MLGGASGYPLDIFKDLIAWRSEMISTMLGTTVVRLILFFTCFRIFSLGYVVFLLTLTSDVINSF